MSGSSSRPPATRGYHQDYIVRIRYNNTLPPPSAPPKLLDIPNTAFAQYTDTSFASKLARSGALNIDVDSELGMPLDLVHMSRVFEGDDAALRPLDPVPPIDPRDRALLRPAASLGKPLSSTVSGGSNVSFLRRTEYISSEQSRSTFRSSTTDRMMNNVRAKRLPNRPEDSDPVRILAAVIKGFDTANPGSASGSSFAASDKAAQNAERNWRELRHPNKPGLKALETFPLLPHVNGTSDNGGYMVFKFSTAPTDGGQPGRRDAIVDAALFQPVEQTNPNAATELFDVYLPAASDVAGTIKRKFRYEDHEEDSDDPDKEYRYNYLRRYEAKHSRSYAGANSSHPEELAMTLTSGGAAHIYPVLTRYVIRPHRRGRPQLGMIGMSQSQTVDEGEGEPPADVLRLRVRDMEPAEKKRRTEYSARWDPTKTAAEKADEEMEDFLGKDKDEAEDEDDEELEVAKADAVSDADSDADADGDVDVDAEGDDDDDNDEDEDAPGDEE